MIKELTPLQKLNNLYAILCHYSNKCGVGGAYTEEECGFNAFELKKDIETKLKRLSVYEKYDINPKPEDDVDKLTELNGKLTYIDKLLDTQERLIMSVSSEEINILSKVFNSQVKKVRKQLKALEIIKECLVSEFKLFEKDGEYFILFYFEEINELLFELRNKEEYDLLKEVLENVRR